MNTTVSPGTPLCRKALVRQGLLLAASTLCLSLPAFAQSTANNSGDDELIELSPFEVISEANGYYQANTMSGTRLNTKVEDLGQSITVMTKEQMADFAMLDINDVFDYMASTEGTSTYSDFAVDRTGAVTDNISLDPNNANRVRGIGSANVAFGNIQMSGRVPVDPLWMESIEVSRGPNANIFGLGNVSGTVNQVPATANLFRDFTRVEARVDSYEGWRSSIDFNRIVLDDKLAVRASLAHQHTGFIRKPSGEDARRVSFQIKAQPLKRTTIALSYFNYTNESQRPNFTTPRDNISAWIANGRPSWDTVNRKIVIDGVSYGQSTGNTVSATSNTVVTRLPSYFVFSPSDARSLIRLGQDGETPYFTTPTVTSTTTPMTGVSNNIQYVATAPLNNYGSNQPLFASYAALSDKSIYDWEEVNLMAANKQWDDVDIYLGQIDQIFLNNSMHRLAAQATVLRESADQRSDQPLGSASVNGVNGELYVDANLYNLDGTPNAFYGRPYVRSKEPFLRERPIEWDTVRAQVAYRIDFSAHEGWSKWLGSHQFLGYYEYKDRENRQYTWRHTAVSRDQAWQQTLYDTSIPLGNRVAQGAYGVSPNHARMYEFYYVGDNVGGNVDYAPDRFPNGTTVPFVWGNTGNFNYSPTEIGWTPTTDGSGGNSANNTVIKTSGIIMQNMLWDERIVTTFGTREDKIYERNAPFATLTPDLYGFDYDKTNEWTDGTTWRLAEGKTNTASVVVRPFRDNGFLNGKIENGTAVTRFFAELVEGTSLTWNKADSFIPAGPAVDLFLRPLPNQTGESTDYGLWLNLFNDKLTIRYNHFKTEQLDNRNGDIATIAQRVLRADGILNSTNADAWNLQDRAEDWIIAANPTWTEGSPQTRAAVAQTMGLTTEFMDTMEAYGDRGQIAATQDRISEGDELEINYNPTRYWTISGSVTKTEAINANAGSVIEDWINSRIAVWDTVEDTRFTPADDPNAGTPTAIPTGATGHLLWRYIKGSKFTPYNYNATNSAATNFETFVAGPLAVYRQLEGRPVPQQSKYSAKFSTRFSLSGITEQRYLKNLTVGGSVRWIDEKAIGFYGEGYTPDVVLGVPSDPNYKKITKLDVNRPVYTPAETYIDLFITYKMKLFDDKVDAKIQLNVKNLGEGGGGLLATQVFPDGTPLAYRIIDPQQFVLSTTFEF